MKIEIHNESVCNIVNELSKFLKRPVDDVVQALIDYGVSYCVYDDYADVEHDLAYACYYLSRKGWVDPNG